jgi:hypothetical protein
MGLVLQKTCICRKGLTEVEYRPLIGLFGVETAGKPKKSPQKAVRMG